MLSTDPFVIRMFLIVGSGSLLVSSQDATRISDLAVAGVPGAPCLKSVPPCPENSHEPCPEPELVEDYTPCGGGAKCWRGMCVAYCVHLGHAMNPKQDLWPCRCTERPLDLCYHCCTNRQFGWANCIPTQHPLQDGAACPLGSCQKGVCVMNDTDHGGLLGRNTPVLHDGCSSPAHGEYPDGTECMGGLCISGKCARASMVYDRVLSYVSASSPAARCKTWALLGLAHASLALVRLMAT